MMAGANLPRSKRVPELTTMRGK